MYFYALISCGVDVWSEKNTRVFIRVNTKNITLYELIQKANQMDLKKAKCKKKVNLIA